MSPQDYFTVRKQTLELCKPLQIEDYNLQAVDFVSPPKWHLAHTTWFFEEFILKQYATDYQLFDTGFSKLFNSYYNTVGKRIARHHRGLISRPTLENVKAYRTYVDDHMQSLISNGISEYITELILLGLNHEQQHQELLQTDLLYSLHQSPVYPVYQKHNNYHSSENETQGWVSIEEGVYEIGSKAEGFCYDNELGRHKVYLHAFELSKSLVTNGEYLAFIEDGGYQNFDFWLDEGWAWVNQHQIQHPLYWEKHEDAWQQFTLAGLQKLDSEAILSHISYYEANAFARWKGMRLPTEFEWEVASKKINWGQRWEWTNSAYLPYPNFKIKEGAVGEYNGKFMINQMVLRGASVATSKNHSRNTYRNFFHPQMQWQFSGIRLVR